MGWIYFASGFFAGIVFTLVIELMVILFWPSKPKKFTTMGSFEIDDKELPK